MAKSDGVYGSCELQAGAAGGNLFAALKATSPVSVKPQLYNAQGFRRAPALAPPRRLR